MTKRRVTRTDGKTHYLAGVSRSGKSHHAIQLAKRHARLLAWDPEAEWAAHGMTPIYAANADELRRVAATVTAGQYAFVAPPNATWFEFFCACAFAWVRLYPGGVVVDELADVTTPGKAPDSWGTLVRRGKKWGMYLYAITNRPAESDKTALANADAIYCHALNRPEDRAYMARYLDCDPDQLAGIVPWQYLGRDRPLATPVLAGDVNPEFAQKS